MPELQPFTGHLVAAASARTVVAPPYDSLSAVQRDTMAAADPDSFLNALPAGGRDDTDELERTLDACRRSVDRLVAAGRFTPIDRPALAVIAIGTGDARTTAVVGDLPASAFGDDPGPHRVLPHERTDPTRIAQLARYLEVVGTSSSPVAVTHRPDDEVASATRAVVADPPRVAFRGEDGVDIAAWIVDDRDLQEHMIGAVRGAGRLYVADGHHRAAAVLAYATRRGATAATAAGRVLTAVIPSDRLHVLPFHRRIVGAPTAETSAILERLHSRGLQPRELPGPAAPDTPGSVTVTAEGRWWSVDLTERRASGAVEGLDVRLAEREIIVPLTAPQTGSDGPAAGVRIEPVAAPSGLDALVGDGIIGVALPPPGVEAILDVADAGLSMPAKTTYVTPKLRSGLLLTPR